MFEDLDGALLSVWGRSSTDVWAVGADPGDGPTVLHYDGQNWRAFDTGTSGTLWWVNGDENGNVWMAGDRGQIVRYDEETSRFEVFDTPAEIQLFGIWAFGQSDVWAVGGDYATDVGIVWHYDGVAWSVVDDIPVEAAETGLFFKVWGRSSNDLWIVGLGGIALHRTTDGWSTLEVPSSRRLFTVHGNESDAIAVGGFQSALTVRATPTALEDVTVVGMPQLNGVWMNSDGTATAVGIQGSVYTWDGTAWAQESAAPFTNLDYHAVYVDPEGGIWAVGGFIVSDPFDDGLLTHRGESLPTEIIPTQ